MNMKVDEDNGKALGIVNGWYQQFWRFSSNWFLKNIDCLVLAPTFGLEVLSLWDKEEEININGKNRKMCSISINVYLYEVYLSYIIYCLMFYFMNIITHLPPPPCQICGITLNRGKNFRKYWPKIFELEEDKAKD